VQHIKRPLLIPLAMSLLSIASFAQDFTEDAIAQRIAPVGDVYLNGEIATAETENSSTQSTGPRTAEKIYNTYCMACHATGAAGAPIKGNADAWQPRVAQGPETLLTHAIQGFNAMPAKGTCADCSDDEIAATIEFITRGLY